MPIASVIAGQTIDPAWGNSVAAAVNPSAWTVPAFQNGWVHFAGGYQSIQYRRINADLVYLRGLMTSGTMPSVAFTLPVGFRPPATVQVPFPGSATFIDITPAGTVLVSGGTNGAVVVDVCFSVLA